MSFKPQLAEDAVLDKVIFPCLVQPKIDALKAQGHKQRAIAKALGVHWRTIATVLKRQGAYSAVPR